MHLLGIVLIYLGSPLEGLYHIPYIPLTAPKIKLFFFPVKRKSCNSMMDRQTHGVARYEKKNTNIYCEKKNENCDDFVLRRPPSFSKNKTKNNQKIGTDVRFAAPV